MIGKIIGGLAGREAAKRSSAIGGTTGAALGVIAPMILRRLSLPGMIALGVGGYVAKKVFDKKDEQVPATDTAPEVYPTATPATT